MSRRLDLSSSKAKLGRAEHHLNELQTDISTWTNGNGEPALGLRYEAKTDPDRLEVFSTHVKPVKTEWSLIIGDVLANLGAALDHIAWQLVQTGSCPKAPPEKIYFPLYRTTRKDFLTKVTGKELPGVSTRRLLLLSPFQPYKRRQEAWYFVNKSYLRIRALPGPLLTLKDLLRVDKHRDLLVTLFRPYRWSVSPGFVKQIVPDTIGPLEPNARLVTFILHAPIPPGVSYDEVAMHAQFTPTVGFKEAGTAVVETLEDMVTEVGQVQRKLGG